MGDWLTEQCYVEVNKAQRVHERARLPMVVHDSMNQEV